MTQSERGYKVHPRQSSPKHRISIELWAFLLVRGPGGMCGAPERQVLMHVPAPVEPFSASPLTFVSGFYLLAHILSISHVLTRLERIIPHRLRVHHCVGKKDLPHTRHHRFFLAASLLTRASATPTVTGLKKIRVTLLTLAALTGRSRCSRKTSRNNLRGRPRLCFASPCPNAWNSRM